MCSRIHRSTTQYFCGSHCIHTGEALMVVHIQLNTHLQRQEMLRAISGEGDVMQTAITSMHSHACTYVCAHINTNAAHSNDLDLIQVQRPQ